MKQKTKARIFQILRKIHATLGIMVFPLVLIAGFTGFYLNHAKTLFSFLSVPPYDEAQFNDWPDALISPESVSDLAFEVFPNRAVDRIYRETYHDRASYVAQLGGTRLIVSRATGHYFIRTAYKRVTFAPDGSELHSKFYWGSLFKRLHVRGWPSDRFGIFLADVVAIALMGFAVTGAVVWTMPRVGRVRRRLKRPRQTAQLTPAE